MKSKLDDCKWYGKSTKIMQSKGIRPYSWDKEPVFNPFIPLENCSLEGKLTYKVEHCQSISDFFCFFINDEMVEIIFNATNQKINNKCSQN